MLYKKKTTKTILNSTKSQVYRETKKLSNTTKRKLPNKLKPTMCALSI